jgi:mRNA interferase MazF
VTAPLPRRGDVWTVDLGEGRGSRQRGPRPALVVQNDTGNQYAATTIVAAITSTIKIYPVTVPLEKGEGGLDRRSMVNLSQVFTIAKECLRRRLGVLSSERMESIDRAIKISLDVA